MMTIYDEFWWGNQDSVANSNEKKFEYNILIIFKLIVDEQVLEDQTGPEGVQTQLLC
jgi:hypothetical protein